MLRKLLLVSKKVTFNNSKFVVYYAYLLKNEKDSEGYFLEETRKVTDRETGNPIEIPITLKVIPMGDFKEMVTKSNDFPYVIEVDDLEKDNKGRKTFSLGIDKDTKTGAPRIDKHGNKHYVAFISNVKSITHYETRGISITDIKKD